MWVCPSALGLNLFQLPSSPPALGCFGLSRPRFAALWGLTLTLCMNGFLWLSGTSLSYRNPVMSTELGETELNWGTLQYWCKIAPGKRAGSKETSLCCLVLAFCVTRPKILQLQREKNIYFFGVYILHCLRAPQGFMGGSFSWDPLQMWGLNLESGLNSDYLILFHLRPLVLILTSVANKDLQPPPTGNWGWIKSSPAATVESHS